MKMPKHAMNFLLLASVSWGSALGSLNQDVAFVQHQCSNWETQMCSNGSVLRIKLCSHGIYSLKNA